MQLLPYNNQIAFFGFFRKKKVDITHDFCRLKNFKTRFSYTNYMPNMKKNWKYCSLEIFKKKYINSHICMSVVSTRKCDDVALNCRFLFFIGSVCAVPVISSSAVLPFYEINEKSGSSLEGKNASTFAENLGTTETFAAPNRPRPFSAATYLCTNGSNLTFFSQENYPRAFFCQGLQVSNYMN